MTRMTGPDCVVMCNLINTHTHTHTHTYTHTHTHTQKKKTHGWIFERGMEVHIFSKTEREDRGFFTHASVGVPLEKADISRRIRRRSMKGVDGDGDGGRGDAVRPFCGGAQEGTRGSTL